MFFKHKKVLIPEALEKYKAYSKCEPPQSPPTRIVRDGDTRIFHCKPQKSKPNPPRSQYGTRTFNSEPPKGSKPKKPCNQYGNNSSGSIDNSDLDILLKNEDKKLPKWASDLTVDNVLEIRTNINKIKDTGLIKEEQEISDLIVNVWNKFIKLKQTHPSDLEEVQRAIHMLQSVLAMRTVRRDYPNQWVSHKEDGD